MRVNVAQSPPPPPPSPSYSLSPHSPQNTLPSSFHLHRSSSKSTARKPLSISCNATFDDHDFPKFPTPKTTSFLRHVDVLEPSFLGIRPDPPDWPARDAVIRECIARRANSIDIPLSLRMIAMKQKFLRLEEERDIDIHLVENNPLNHLVCSTLCIMREVQNHALKNRELDDEIVSKVQREMTTSFVWLFKEVFAKTPDFMVQVMVLTSNFATHSLDTSNLVSEEKVGRDLGVNSGFWGVGHLELGNSGVPTREILEKMEESDVWLWNSVVEEADQIRGDKVKDQRLGFVVDHDYDYEYDYDGVNEKFEFVSPVKVEIEKDDYEEYHKTDLFYQIGLYQDPNNTLLLSNYAQFLCLVSRDYDRAEECFKRAIQLDRSDAEVESLYANFLWVVRKDLWGAEERFQQAVAAEPDNSYHASKYASFLWSTGGEETCYPIDTPRGSS